MVSCYRLRFEFELDVIYAPPIKDPKAILANHLVGNLQVCCTCSCCCTSADSSATKLDAVMDSREAILGRNVVIRVSSLLGMTLKAYGPRSKANNLHLGFVLWKR